MILSVAQRIATFALLIATHSGCAVPIKPDDLQTPKNITCVQLTEPLSFTGHYGLFDVPWTTRLAKGPYLSEKVDTKGTYYRGPQGGLSIGSKNGTGLPGQGQTSDGGFYIPFSTNEPVTIYRYFSVQAAPVDTLASDVNCSTVGYVKEASSSSVSLVSFAAAGAIGGATGGVIGRSAAQGSTMSYGQAAGVGAAGGLIAGVIIAALINADVGKIVPGQPIQDPQFMAKLRELAASGVPAKQVQLPTAATASRDGTAAEPVAPGQSDRSTSVAYATETRLNRAELEALTRGRTWHFGIAETGAPNVWEFSGSQIYARARGITRSGDWQINDKDEVCLKWRTRQFPDQCLWVARRGDNFVLTDSGGAGSELATISVK